MRIFVTATDTEEAKKLWRVNSVRAKRCNCAGNEAQHNVLTVYKHPCSPFSVCQCTDSSTLANGLVFFRFGVQRSRFAPGMM